MYYKLTFYLFFFSVYISFAQQNKLTPNAEISILTVGPGKSLNDAFGHNAFRIKDRANGIDVVYGYGEYDFDTPNFYLKFARGKLNYLISKHKFSDFYATYSYYNRSIKEQILNLTGSQKQKLYDYLITNYKPENRRYLYDFFYDNCATRIRDVAKIAIGDYIEFAEPENYESKTFRQLIHEHVGLNTWGSFGIDIALGSVVDKEATPYQQMFLPKYIHTYFTNAEVGSSVELVKNSSVIFKKREEKTNSNFLLSPIIIMAIVSCFILFITYKDYRNKRHSKLLDIILFSITGLLGIVILLLWFATDHTATAQNYNVLWAFPLNVIVVFQLLKKEVKKWIKGYIKFLIVMLCLMTLHWLIGVQVFALALIPFIVALFVRFTYILKTLNYR